MAQQHIPILPNATPNINAPLPKQAVKHIKVRLPPFSKHNPTLWFHQIETIFAHSAIIDDLTKFYSIVSVIDTDVLSSITDIISNPPTNKLYETTKQRLIQYYA